MNKKSITLLINNDQDQMLATLKSLLITFDKIKLQTYLSTKLNNQLYYNKMLPNCE